MVSARFVCAALFVVFLSACSLFDSEATRKEKVYERYIGESQKARAQRQRAIAKQEAAIPQAPPVRQDVQTQTDTNPTAPEQQGAMPVQPTPDSAPAPPPQ